MADELDLDRLEPNAMIESPRWSGPVVFLGLLGKDGARKIVIQAGDA